MAERQWDNCRGDKKGSCSCTDKLFSCNKALRSVICDGAVEQPVAAKNKKRYFRITGARRTDSFLSKVVFPQSVSY